MKHKINVFIVLLTMSCNIISSCNYKKIGNLAVRSAFQPGPLFAKGQKMLDKNEIVFYEIPLFLKERHGREFREFSHNFLYGISDRCSFLISPINGYYRNDFCKCFHKFFYLPTALEYAYYVHETLNSISKLSVLGTGFLFISKKISNPPLGFRAYPFSLGLTARYLSIDWYLFADLFVLLPSKNHKRIHKSSLLFDWGIGYNIKHVKDMVFLLMWEFNGDYNQKDLLCKKRDPLSGGTIIFSGPTLWISSNYLKIQAGFQWPLFGHIGDKKIKNSFRVGLYITIALN